MRALKVIGGGLLATALVAMLLQRNAISNARQENGNLLEQRTQAERFRLENEAIPQLREQNREMEPLRTANQDLLKLRNEVRQLRAQTPEVETLRRQNQRLASEIKSMAGGHALPFSQMEGYVAKETWANAGFSTPEAALQTFLWAAREGQFERIAECMSPESRPRFEKQFANKTEEERQKVLQQGLGQLTHMGGYRLVGKEQFTHEVALSIQAAAGGVVAKVVLRRFGDEWKFHDVADGRYDGRE